ncbi:NAD(P)-binding protein [Lepidopterella palustris CBS 459.81]|uniref:NAD(P)-binding protein n=1 Tax=Lepidopterella palustris CBS 459.81 TaxID=1314670 RepID=A0A8E2EG84_9PEZI|nr:NAD(P)-binding protein [Lepidopterella palustris CBS 459.81]
MSIQIPDFFHQIVSPTTPFDPSKPLPDTNILRGKSILITGGASGLGAASVRQLASLGSIVTIADVQTDAGTTLAQELTSQGHRVSFVTCDVTSWESQVSAFKHAISFGGGSIDIVVPFAGIVGETHIVDQVSLHPASLDTDPPPARTNTISVNLLGVYNTAYLAVHYFRLPAPIPAGPHSHAQPTNAHPFKKTILFISSIAGYVSHPNSSTYCAAKFGVRGLWQGMQKKAFEAGVRTNLIAPWYIKTPMTMREPADPEMNMELMGFVPIEGLVDAVVRVLADEECQGRAVAVFPEGNFDLGDNLYEGFAGPEMQRRLLERFKGITG